MSNVANNKMTMQQLRASLQMTPQRYSFAGTDEFDAAAAAAEFAAAEFAGTMGGGQGGAAAAATEVSPSVLAQGGRRPPRAAAAAISSSKDGGKGSKDRGAPPPPEAPSADMQAAYMRRLREAIATIDRHYEREKAANPTEIAEAFAELFAGQVADLEEFDEAFRWTLKTMEAAAAAAAASPAGSPLPPAPSRPPPLDAIRVELEQMVLEAAPLLDYLVAHTPTEEDVAEATRALEEAKQEAARCEEDASRRETEWKREREELMEELRAAELDLRARERENTLLADTFRKTQAQYAQMKSKMAANIAAREKLLDDMQRQLSVLQSDVARIEAEGAALVENVAAGGSSSADETHLHGVSAMVRAKYAEAERAKAAASAVRENEMRLRRLVASASALRDGDREVIDIRREIEAGIEFIRSIGARRHK